MPHVLEAAGGKEQYRHKVYVTEALIYHIPRLW